jgi:hypothetical protein
LDIFLSTFRTAPSSPAVDARCFCRHVSCFDKARFDHDVAALFLAASQQQNQNGDGACGEVGAVQPGKSGKCTPKALSASLLTMAM